MLAAGRPRLLVALLSLVLLGLAWSERPGGDGEESAVDAGGNGAATTVGGDTTSVPTVAAGTTTTAAPATSGPQASAGGTTAAPTTKAPATTAAPRPSTTRRPATTAVVVPGCPSGGLGSQASSEARPVAENRWAVVVSGKITNKTTAAVVIEQVTATVSTAGGDRTIDATVEDTTLARDQATDFNASAELDSTSAPQVKAVRALVRWADREDQADCPRPS